MIESEIDHAPAKPPGFRARTLAPWLAGAISIVIYALPLWNVWRTYFPYEDDFSLIYYSWPEYQGHPAEWLTTGMRYYFANDPSCNLNNWRFWRPLWNFTHYLDGAMSRTLGGPHLMIVNILVLGACVMLVFRIALRLGLSWPPALFVTSCFAMSPGWTRAMTHSTYRADTLALFWGLLCSVLVLRGIERPQKSWANAVLIAGTAVALGLATHEQSVLFLVCNGILLLVLIWGRMNWRGCARLLALFALPSIAMLLVRTLIGPPPAFLAGRSDEPFRIVQVARWCWAFFRILRPTATPVAMTGAWWTLTILNAGLLMLIAVALFGRRRQVDRRTIAAFAMAAVAVVAAFDLEERQRLFPHLWLFIGVACLWQAYQREGTRRLGLWAATAAASVIVVFSLWIHVDEVWGKRGAWLARNQADRISFERMREAIRANPPERVLLVNDQLGLWSSKAMLRVAGFDGPMETTPSAGAQYSNDFLPGAKSCPADIGSTADGRDIILRMRHSSTPCLFQTYALDMACAARQYRKDGLTTDVAWINCLAETQDSSIAELTEKGPHGREAPCSPLEFRPRVPPGPGTLIVAWTDRYRPATVYRNSLPRYSAAVESGQP